MIRLKKYKTSFQLSLIISFFSIGFFILLQLFYNQIPLKEIKFDFILLLFFLLFFSCFIFLQFRLEHFFFKKIQEIYKDISPTDFPSKSMLKDENMESFSQRLRSFALNRKIELDFLKDQESYRREFLGNVSHELKTPLFTIQGYVLTLLDGALKDKKLLEKYLKRTSKGVDRLIYIVKDLDLITKIESGTQTIESKPFNIIETIENVFELLEMEASKNTIKLVFDRAYPKPILVFADEERIQQVITNLVINSLKYGVSKGTTEISLEPLYDKKLLVRITDNGEGIDKEHMPRLFERFYRVDKTRSRDQGGSGLGLSIVKHIIEAHQEKIFVESELGVGSDFSFTLPMYSE